MYEWSLKICIVLKIYRSKYIKCIKINLDVFFSQEDMLWKQNNLNSHFLKKTMVLPVVFCLKELKSL